MVGNFSDPLNFNPHLINLHDIFDSEYDNDIDFREWKYNRLYVSCGKEEKSLSVKELRNMINELTTKGK